MVSLGLLGAIGGVGQAMQTIGGDIVKRRERALEEARREAEYQRSLADRREDAEAAAKRAEKAFERRDASTNLRTDKQIAAANERFEKGQIAKTQDREDKQRAAEDLAKMKAELAKEVAAAKAVGKEAAIRLKRELSKDDVKGLVYGPPDARDYAAVSAITRGGGHRPLGFKAYRPNKKDDEDEDGLLPGVR